MHNAGNEIIDIALGRGILGREGVLRTERPLAQRSGQLQYFY
jgi:hypothetical protein